MNILYNSILSPDINLLKSKIMRQGFIFFIIKPEAYGMKAKLWGEKVCFAFN